MTANERRPFQERVVQWMVRRPYRDERGRKGLFTPLARAQAHRVVRHRLTLPGWPRFERPLRIAFLTDFHIGSHTGDLVRHAAIVAEAAALDPDLVLFGGDYVNSQYFGGGRIPPRAIAPILAPLAGRHGRFAILGNHDYIYDADDVAAALRGQGITVLDHERGAFMFEGHSIDVAGVPDAHFERPQGRALLDTLDPARPAIVLAHDPFWFKHLPRGPFVMLSGHTHGGQVRLPGLGILKNSSKAPLHWSHGAVVEDGRHLFVSAGLGTSAIPLRIGVPPEYALIEVTGP